MNDATVKALSLTPLRIKASKKITIDEMYKPPNQENAIFKYVLLSLIRLFDKST